MEHKSKFATLAVALLAMVGILSLTGCDSRHNEESKQFPDKLTHRVALKPESAHEVIRYVDYASDGVTKLRGQIEYTNGNTGYVVYRKDGTISDVRIEFPLAEGQSQRQTMRVLKLDADGKTYLHDEVYRTDGTLDHSGSRQSDSVYEVMFYHPDGLNVQRHQRFMRSDAKTWDLAIDETFRLDHTRQSLLSMQGDGTTNVTTFYEDGVTKASESTTDVWNTSKVTTFYWPDGKTVKAKWEQGTWYVAMQEHRPDGTRALLRRFSSNQLAVTVFNAKGEPSYTQEFWVNKDPTFMDPSTKVNDVQYVLRRITYHRADGKALKIVELADNGKRVTGVTIPSAGDIWNRTEKKYRDDGTLETVEVYKNGNVVSTQKHAASENIREHVDSSHLLLKPFDPPPPNMVPKRRGFGGFF